MEPPVAAEEHDTTPATAAAARSSMDPEAPTPPSSTFLEIRLFYLRISPCAPDAVPPHLTLSHLRHHSNAAPLDTNGPGVPPSLSLRRDRLDRDAAEVTYVTTDAVRLTAAVDLEMSDDRGNLILSGSLDPKNGWAMDCALAPSVGSSAFVQPKLGITAPSFEVYVAGCFAGSPVILTQTIHLAQSPPRKAPRMRDMESVPKDDDDDKPMKDQRGEEGSHCRKAPSSSSVMEPFHNTLQPQAHMGQTYPYQLVNHPQYHSQFSSQPSPMQFQYQAHMVQPSPIVQILPQPHYQPPANSQYSHMQPQCQQQRLQSQAQDQTQSQEQLQCQSQTNKRGTPNKRWKPHYDDFLIPFLVEQAREGMKVDKTFKRHAFVAASAAVNSRFRESFTWENVENHMRTLKTKYQEIKKCRELHGAVWNDDLKMITLDDSTYQTYIEANPKSKDYINKPIDNYEGLKIICGDEPVTYKKNIFQQFGSRQPALTHKTGDATDLDQEQAGHDEEVEAPAVGSTCTEQHQPTTPQGPTQTAPVAPPSPSSSRNGRAYKRLRENIESVIMELAQKVGDVAEAINKARPTHWTAELYERIMELDEFGDTIQEAVFDTLRRDEAEARAFIVKNKMMRRSWMERFVAEHFSD